MKGRHLGIFALALLPLLLTIPSAFADNDLSILDALDDLDNLQTISDNNNFDIDFEPVRSLYLAALEDPSLFAEAEAAHDDLYGEIYDNIEGQQAVRHEEYVINAQASLSFLVEHGESLGLSETVVEQLAATLEILEYGTNAEIDAGTGQIGITLSVLPDFDPALPKSFTTGSGDAEQLKAKLPPGILKKYGYSTDSGIGTASHEGDENGNGENHGDDLPPGYDKMFDGTLESLPNGFQKQFDGVLAFLNGEDDLGDLPDGFAKMLDSDKELPKGFVKKFDAIFDFISYGDTFESDIGSSLFDDTNNGKKKDCKGKECGKGHDKNKNKNNNGNSGSGGNGGGNGGGN